MDILRLYKISSNTRYVRVFVQETRYYELNMRYLYLYTFLKFPHKFSFFSQFYYCPKLLFKHIATLKITERNKIFHYYRPKLKVDTH